jgi:inner membrane protein
MTPRLAEVAGLHPPTHLVASWLVGHRLPVRRDRVLVAWAGMAPDLDGLMLLAGVEMYGRWHHVLTHGLVFAVLTSAGCALFASARWRVALLAFVAFHLHVVCDLLGSGVEWTISYFYPLSDWQLATPYGWPLDSWQNYAVTAVLLVACAAVGLRRGYSVTEAFLTARADREVVAALRLRFGAPGAAGADSAAGRP